MQGGATGHTTAEIRAFFIDSFRAVSSAAKPRSSDSHIVPTSLNSSGLMPWFTCTNKSHQLSMDWKNLQGHGAHDSKADNPRPSGQYPQKKAMPANKLKATILSSLSGASFIFFLWIILLEICPHIRCQSRKITLFNIQILWGHASFVCNGGKTWTLLFIHMYLCTGKHIKPYFPHT